MKKLLILICMVCTVLATAFTTYRIVMLNLRIEVEDNTAFVTVFNQTDYYTIDCEEFENESVAS